MAAGRCLVLYGSSVFLAGIQAMLADRLAGDAGAPLQTISVEAGQPALIRARRPQAVLFDLAESLPDFIAAVLREQIDLLLIGVDPSCDEALVLSVKPQRALSAYASATPPSDPAGAYNGKNFYGCLQLFDPIQAAITYIH